MALLSATTTAGYLCRVNVSTAGAMMMQEFSLTQVEMGRIFTAFLLGYTLFQIPAGVLADRFGARRVLSIATWLWAAITILQVLAGWGPFEMVMTFSITTFMIFRFLLGIAESPKFPGSAQCVSRWIPTQFQGRANSIVLSSVGLGSALTPPLVSYVMVHAGWRPAMIVSAVPALIVAIIWSRVPEQRPMALTAKPQMQVHEKSNLGSRSFLLLTFSYLLQSYVGYIFISWFYLYLVQERHFGLLGGAWMSSLPWVLTIIAIPLGGFLNDRLSASRLGPTWGTRVIPMVAMSMSAILISIGAQTDSAWTAAISLAFATALILCVEGPFWTMMMRIAGGRSGTGGGIMNFGGNVGGLISPLLTPFIATYIGWENALHIAAGLAVVGAGLWLGVQAED